MKEKLQRYIPLTFAVILGVLCLWVLLIYVKPMSDVSLDLSLVSQEDALIIDPKDFDDKGWSVYTQQGSVRTELTPDGYGGYLGIELGQTFYLSRVLDEDLDSPTLQLGASEWTFSVWLDEDLIYTDCPHLDNRIGQLKLPMNDWFREDYITISLPADYQGKTLTIAQSSPEWTETGRIVAWPTTIRLYCGYAYESELIAETTKTTLHAAFVFLLVQLLLVAFVRNRDWSILFLAVVAFFRMVRYLLGTSYSFRYFSSVFNTLGNSPTLMVSLALLCYLTLRSGSHRKYIWIPVAAYAISVCTHLIVYLLNPVFPSSYSFVGILADFVPYWLASISIVVVLVLGTICWRKENSFYRVFIPLSYAGIILCWITEFIHKRGAVWQNIIGNLSSGQILYIFSYSIPGITAAALITAILEACKKERDRREEQQLVQQYKELALSSYENLRSQHEEVMMIRHDIKNHFILLRGLAQNPEAQAYLDNLIEDNEKIRPVIQSGNKVFDIILNSKINRATAKGIRVEVIRANIVNDLPIPDADLCSLIMNLLDNAIAAASRSRESAMIELDMHIRGAFFIFSCTNSAPADEDSTPSDEYQAERDIGEHGLGLKIVQNIADRYNCLMQTGSTEKAYHVTVAIPLDYIPPEG